MAVLAGQGEAALTTLGCQLEPVSFAQNPNVALALGESCPFQDIERAVILLPTVVKLANQLDTTVLCPRLTTAVQEEIAAANCW